MTLYTEFGQPIIDPSERTEAFSTFIQFTTEEEPTHYAEIYVSHDEIKFYEDETTVEQYKEVYKYAEESQKSISQYLIDCKDDEDTKAWLNKTAHW